MLCLSDYHGPALLTFRFQTDLGRQNSASYLKMQAGKTVPWDQALFSFRFENYIPAGKAKRKDSLIQTFYETSSAHFFDWLTFAESANQNYVRCLFF